MDPLELNTACFLDALIYAISADFTTAAVVLTIEVQPEFHKGTDRLLPDSSDAELMIDFVFSGTRSIRVADLPPRTESWADDEKPHDYEISTFRVRKLRLHYRVEITCQLGQKIAIEFDSVRAVRSQRSAGVIHEYGVSESSARSH